MKGKKDNKGKRWIFREEKERKRKRRGEKRRVLNDES